MARAWMPLYVADYLADTGHLSTVEHGAYLLLIMHYWQNGALPDDDRKLARVCRMAADEWAEVRDTMADLFEDGWRHGRIEAELAKSDQVSSKRRAAGKAGAKARYSKSDADANGNRIANATDLPKQTHRQSQSQSQKNPIPSELSAGGASEDLKSQVFGAGLAKLSEQSGKPANSLRSVVGKWCRDHGDGAVLEAMIACARASPVEPVAWITKHLANGNVRQSAGAESRALIAEMGDWNDAA